MINTFYSISEEVSAKNIYIYGINRTSVMLFTELSLWGGNVSGFVDDEEERFVGEYFMNRPILCANQMKDEKESIIVIANILKKNMVANKIQANIPIFYRDEVIVPREELRKKEVVIYGIGAYGEIMYKQCCEYGIKVKAACVSQKGNVSLWNGVPVLDVSELNVEGDYDFVIATVHLSYCKQMMKKVKDYCGNIYIYSYISQQAVNEGRFFQIIGYAVKMNKEIWIYGKNKELKDKLTEVLTRYSVEIQGEIDDLYKFRSDLINDSLVVISDNDEYEVEQACNILDSLGFSLEKWNYTSLACETVRNEGSVKTAQDLLLGWSKLSNRNYPGYIVYGNDNIDNIRIMILGNSCSTEGIYRTESWVKFFYEKLVHEGYSVTIFNGSTCGYGSTRELLMLLRDGAYMGLDYVVSLTGGNNFTDHGVKNFFSGDLGKSYYEGCAYGVDSKESLYDFWLRNITIIKNVSELYGAKSFSFLQPSPVKEVMSLTETTMYEVQDVKKNVLEFRRMSLKEKKNLYTNMIGFFDKEIDMYIDFLHYSSSGNKLIAEFIYKEMTRGGKITKNPLNMDV